ncbi:Y-family DNA polymerase [Metamycoplasma alkalescens]|uniref:DNA polymerase-4 n=2 Tax=Metamycoplasma alkalescens TaxID=45363 RepID=A0A318U5U2_9BACT|nr:DNA polymerase IV [Metamycoplasma alkalescens]PYF43706.1 DNA polymerase-4 [Metamycoplasma alkalescens]
MNKVIFHIDMDSFFVSCERAKNQSLNNKPIVIASNLKRAIATAMSYEVKKYGFKVGDGFYLMKNKIKDLIAIEPHYQLYSLTSKKIFKFIETFFTNKIEIYSIDECYIDVTEEVKKFNSPYEMAKKIQDEIYKVFKIPCSIGISYTKFLAKMSTNKAKPFGIIETKKEDIKKHFYQLPIKKIFGIGKGIVPKLIRNNINTYEDLVNCQNEVFLKSIFGKNYFLFIQDLKGDNNNRQHVLTNEIKSISNSKTFMEEDSNDSEYLINELREITVNIVKRAEDLNLEGKNISVSIRHQNKLWVHKNKILSKWTNDFEQIWKIVFLLFNEIWNEQKIRGLGVGLGGLKSVFSEKESLNLFEFENKKNSIVEKIINENNLVIGKNKLKTLNQYDQEKNQNKENIRFLRKNFKTYNKKINLEDEWE